MPFAFALRFLSGRAGRTLFLLAAGFIVGMWLGGNMRLASVRGELIGCQQRHIAILRQIREAVEAREAALHEEIERWEGERNEAQARYRRAQERARDLENRAADSRLIVDEEIAEAVDACFDQNVPDSVRDSLDGLRDTIVSPQDAGGT